MISFNPHFWGWQKQHDVYHYIHTLTETKDRWGRRPGCPAPDTFKRREEAAKMVSKVRGVMNNVLSVVQRCRFQRGTVTPLGDRNPSIKEIKPFVEKTKWCSGRFSLTDRLDGWTGSRSPVIVGSWSRISFDWLCRPVGELLNFSPHLSAPLADKRYQKPERRHISQVARHGIRWFAGLWIIWGTLSDFKLYMDVSRRWKYSRNRSNNSDSCESTCVI